MPKTNLTKNEVETLLANAIPLCDMGEQKYHGLLSLETVKRLESESEEQASTFLTNPDIVIITKAEHERLLAGVSKVWTVESGEK